MTNNRLLNNLVWILFLISIFYFGYYQYQKANNQLIVTNFGSANLGKVFEEEVYITISIRGLLDDSEKFIPIAPQSFLDSENNVHNEMEENFKILNKYSSNKDTISYEEASPKVDMRLKIETYIAYKSTNYKNEPFNFQIAEKIYTLPKGKNLKSEISKIISENYQANKQKVAKYLFLTDPEKFILISNKDEL